MERMRDPLSQEGLALERSTEQIRCYRREGTSRLFLTKVRACGSFHGILLFFSAVWEAKLSAKSEEWEELD